MAGIVREFIGLPSPVVARAGRTPAADHVIGARGYQPEDKSAGLTGQIGTDQQVTHVVRDGGV
jgi:hypothetical protein